MSNVCACLDSFRHIPGFSALQLKKKFQGPHLLTVISNLFAGSDKRREIFEKARNIVEPPRPISVMSGMHHDFALGMHSASGISRMSLRESAFAATSADDSAPVKPLFSGSFKKAAETQVGEDLKLTLILKNTVTDPQKIEIKMTATAIIYNNKPVKDFLTKSHSVSLGPNEGRYNVQYVCLCIYKCINCKYCTHGIHKATLLQMVNKKKQDSP